MNEQDDLFSSSRNFSLILRVVALKHTSLLSSYHHCLQRGNNSSIYPYTLGATCAQSKERLILNFGLHNIDNNCSLVAQTRWTNKILSSSFLKSDIHTLTMIPSVTCTQIAWHPLLFSWLVTSTRVIQCIHTYNTKENI